MGEWWLDSSSRHSDNYSLGVGMEPLFTSFQTVAVVTQKKQLRQRHRLRFNSRATQMWVILDDRMVWKEFLLRMSTGAASFFFVFFSPVFLLVMLLFQAFWQLDSGSVRNLIFFLVVTKTLLVVTWKDAAAAVYLSLPLSQILARGAVENGLILSHGNGVGGLRTN